MFSIQINGTFSAVLNCEPEAGMTEAQANEILLGLAVNQIVGLREQAAAYLGGLASPSSFDTGVTIGPPDPALNATLVSSVSGESQV